MQMEDHCRLPLTIEMEGGTNSAVAGLAEQWRGLQRLYVAAFPSTTNVDLTNSVILGVIIYCPAVWRFESGPKRAERKRTRGEAPERPS